MIEEYDAGWPARLEAAHWDTCHQRIFRDWLRDHPDDRAC